MQTLGGAANAQTVVQYVREPVLTNASDLVPACRRVAETHYLAQEASIYHWTASYHNRGDGPHVDGCLRVNGNTVSVPCSAARSAYERELVMQIDETGG
ncbi:hypothetical protein FQK02_21550 [Xanthomonas vasicola]|uniref:hypothetical protein n=1 Tax=Xanthomonas vasicola TaxID=56459 RepID=UPI00034BABA3|nr:hypothetical protein [Xanthomonas vasicola]KFA23912.1 hypothetical protein KW5_0120530 [Xanthomonas vasicola pv. vasculorum NCPPB 1326]KFA34272.1 hypothetical protein KWG_0103875 [Xanthomonas vasicola pv. vasculorum NCPPB 1381]TWQ10968.1 hypothetical protein FQK02_21550 [Xanthomonas vasicola]